MKKLIEDKSILYAIIGLILGVSITGVVAYSVYANKVTYDNTQSGLQSTNVQGAIDELYTKTNTWINPSYIELDKIVSTNTTKKIFATSNGLCIIRKGKISCFKINNWEEEKDHIQQVFSDISCDVSSSRVSCSASDFRCEVYSGGGVGCYDQSDYSGCYVATTGSVGCY